MTHYRESISNKCFVFEDIYFILLHLTIREINAIKWNQGTMFPIGEKGTPAEIRMIKLPIGDFWPKPITQRFSTELNYPVLDANLVTAPI